jgi:chromosomal replication initiator protein
MSGNAMAEASASLATLWTSQYRSLRRCAFIAICALARKHAVLLRPGALIIARRSTERVGETGVDTDTNEIRRNEASEIWDRVRQDLRSSASPSVFNLWLRPLEALEVSGEILVLSAPEPVRAWVERRYVAEITAALQRQSSLGEIGFATSEAEAQVDVPSPLPGSYTFDRFVIGSGNRVAHAAALAVAELPGEAYNPLFIYGPPGLGKTHLMGAIANYQRANHPLLSVRYTSAERFTAEFITALRSDGAEAFKRRHRDVGTLLIDDVQFLEGKQHTEEEFFHTFNVLYEAGHQIVLSSDRPPHGLERLTERLRNRFEWGLAVEICAPDVAMRLLLLEHLIGAHDLPISDPETIRVIAELAPANIRQLEGALTRVAALASVFDEPASPALARQALASSSRPVSDPETSLSIEEIQDAVCKALHIPRSDLISARRTPDVTRARHVAVYLSRELTDLTLAEIGRQFNRDHSTILHAIRSVTRKLEPGSELVEIVKRVRAILNNKPQSQNFGTEVIHSEAQNPQSLTT